ncbi:MAG TPA: XTP/dITP diphosphatase [Actinobacteria bacterium]|nr:XTP/dITP diphosphatase [Actinomycetota bacterium]
MKIVLATRNFGKIREIKEIIDRPGIDWQVFDDQAVWPQVDETGQTFLDNATLKAETLSRFFMLPALADDSGLEVDALGGRPGVQSARFAGESATDAANVAKLLSELEKISKNDDFSRAARFVAAVVFVWPDGRSLSAKGECRGSITRAPSGNNGFGYDPIFIPNGYDKTMAQMSPEEKNKLSHRGRALVELNRQLKL